MTFTVMPANAGISFLVRAEMRRRGASPRPSIRASALRSDNSGSRFRGNDEPCVIGLLAFYLFATLTIASAMR